jgi:uncharacterized phage-associated protein
MAVSIESVARTLGRLSGWSLSNLELQKIAYMAEMIYLGRTGGRRLINEDFEAWDNGPVVPELYHKAKAFGSRPVRDVFTAPELAPGTPEYQAVLDAYNLLRDRNPGQLVAMTHRRTGAWASRYTPGVKGVKIPKQLMLEEYVTRTNG